MTGLYTNWKVKGVVKVVCWQFLSFNLHIQQATQATRFQTIFANFEWIVWLSTFFYFQNDYDAIFIWQETKNLFYVLLFFRHNLVSIFVSHALKTNQIIVIHLSPKRYKLSHQSSKYVNNCFYIDWFNSTHYTRCVHRFRWCFLILN